MAKNKFMIAMGSLLIEKKEDDEFILASLYALY